MSELPPYFGFCVSVSGSVVSLYLLLEIKTYPRSPAPEILGLSYGNEGENSYLCV